MACPPARLVTAARAAGPHGAAMARRTVATASMHIRGPREPVVPYPLTPKRVVRALLPPTPWRRSADAALQWSGDGDCCLRCRRTSRRRPTCGWARPTVARPSCGRRSRRRSRSTRCAAGPPSPRASAPSRAALSRCAARRAARTDRAVLHHHLPSIIKLALTACVSRVAGRDAGRH